MGSTLALKKRENAMMVRREPSPEMYYRIDARIIEASQLHSKSPAAAWPLIEAALEEAESARYDRGRANALRVRAMLHGVTGAVDAALRDFQAAHDLVRTLNAPDLEAACLHGIGMAHKHRGEYALAVEALHRAIQIRRDLIRLETPNHAPETSRNALPEPPSTWGLAMSLNSLGALYGTLGNYKEAAACFTEALAVAEVSGGRRHQQHALCNIALIQVECGNPEAALPFFERSIHLAQEDGESLSLSNNLSNYANTLRKIGRLDDAQKAAEESVVVARSAANPPTEMVALMHLGCVQRDRGELTEAAESLNAALAVAPSHHYLLPPLFLEIATIHQRAGQWESAREYLEEALRRATEVGQGQDISEIHRTLSELFMETGDHASALRHHIAYHEADRELQRQSAQNLMVAQLARIEVEQARKEIEQHRQRTEELAELNSQKSVLLARLQVQADMLAKQATEDPLTGLYNRRYLADFLEREVQRVRRAGLPLTLAIADLDDFKRINDRFSHKVGDEVLKITARLFTENVRGTDVVARYGGEEFVVILPELPVAKAAPAMGRVRAAIAAYPWHEIHPDLTVTVSIGLSDISASPDCLLEAADEHLYAAKLSGKNCVH
jgi:diguanylate cyclase (GGDEF)-like protein